MYYALFAVNLALLCVCGSGILCNVLSVVILTLKRNSIPGARLLLGLSTADGLLLTTVCLYSAQRLCIDLFDLDYTDTPCPDAVIAVLDNRILLALWDWFQKAEVYMVIALAIGRYVAVNKPLFSPIFNSHRHQNSIVVLIFGVSLLLTIPKFLEWRIIDFSTDSDVKWIRVPNYDCLNGNSSKAAGMAIGTSAGTPVSDCDGALCNGSQAPFSGPTANTGTDLLVTTMSNDVSTACANYTLVQSSDTGFSWYVLLYTYVFHFIVLYVIPLPCLFFMNIHFLRGLYIFQERRQSLTQNRPTASDSSRMKRAVRNVVAILTVYLVYHTAFLGIEVYRISSIHVVIGYEFYYENFVLNKVSMLLVALNSASDFWICVTFLAEFRKAMARVVTCGRY